MMLEFYFIQRFGCSSDRFLSTCNTSTYINYISVGQDSLILYISVWVVKYIYFLSLRKIFRLNQATKSQPSVQYIFSRHIRQEIAVLNLWSRLKSRSRTQINVDPVKNLSSGEKRSLLKFNFFSKKSENWAAGLLT